MELVRRGGDRQALHEVIREQSMAAWDVMQQAEPNPLLDALCSDKRLLSYAAAGELRGWLDASGYVGDAPERARRLAATVRHTIDTR